jgi:integrase
MLSINITKRDRKRTLRTLSIVTQTRYVVNYRDPRTGKRTQLFFKRQKDAQSKRSEMEATVHTGGQIERRKSVTVRDAVEAWLAHREGAIKGRTLDAYRYYADYIVGPLLSGTKEQRAQFTETGIKPAGIELLPMLGDVRLQELTTAQIRTWHKTVSEQVGRYSANRSRMHLATALALAAEDYNIRPPTMPANLSRGGPKAKKAILTPAQVGAAIECARRESGKAFYVAFAFLAGTRPSEQLGLLWDDVDFEANVIHVRRMQEPNGTLTEFTKTVAGTREIPLCRLLRSLLLEWRVKCPRLDGELYRVFPGLGKPAPWPAPRSGGGPLLYSNFRSRVWVPTLRRLGLPAVTPHSARHCFISTMQAQGIEVGLVAKIAGHANASVTLGHYTQAVRGAENAVEALERAFTA